MKLEEFNKSLDEYFADMEYVQQRLISQGKILSDETLVNNLLFNLPEEYDSKVEYIKQLIGSGKKLELVEVMEHLRARHKFLIRRRNMKGAIGEAAALVVSEFM